MIFQWYMYLVGVKRGFTLYIQLNGPEKSTQIINIVVFKIGAKFFFEHTEDGGIIPKIIALLPDALNIFHERQSS